MTSMTVVVPMTIRRRGGRKQIIGPDGAEITTTGADVAPTHGDPALVKALARGFRWRRMLEGGRYASVRDLAAAEGVDRGYIGRVLNLTLLAPKIVEAILDGCPSATMSQPALSESSPPCWEDQWRAYGKAKPDEPL